MESCDLVLCNESIPNLEGKFISHPDFKELDEKYKYKEDEHQLNVKKFNEDQSAFYRRTLCTNSEFISTYGPLNPHVPMEGQRKYCNGSPNGKCTMYCCDCFNGEEEFEGICTECETKISSKYKSFRAPMENGGFKHYFCGIICAHQYFSYLIDDDIHIYIDIMYLYTQRYKCNTIETKDDSDSDSDSDSENELF